MIIPQTKYETLEPGTYRARVGAVSIESGEYGDQAAFRFDLLDEGLETHSLRAWASAKLSGGKRPSKLYTWTAALLFNGRGVPEGYDLDTETLIGRETLVLVEVVQKDGLERNRVAGLLPLRQAAPARPVPASAPAPVAVAVGKGEPEGAAVPGWLGDDGEMPF